MSQCRENKEEINNKCYFGNYKKEEMKKDIKCDRDEKTISLINKVFKRN